MGGSSKPKGPSDEQRRNEQRALEIQEEQLALAKKPIELPNIEPPKPLPPPPPPAMESGEVAQKMEDERRKAAKRTNTARNTIFGGETGGYQKPSLGGKTTLLG